MDGAGGREQSPPRTEAGARLPWGQGCICKQGSSAQLIAFALGDAFPVPAGSAAASLAHPRTAPGIPIVVESQTSPGSARAWDPLVCGRRAEAMRQTLCPYPYEHQGHGGRVVCVLGTILYHSLFVLFRNDSDVQGQTLKQPLSLQCCIRLFQAASGVGSFGGKAHDFSNAGWHFHACWSVMLHRCVNVRVRRQAALFNVGRCQGQPREKPTSPSPTSQALLPATLERAPGSALGAAV